MLNYKNKLILTAIFFGLLAVFGATIMIICAGNIFVKIAGIIIAMVGFGLSMGCMGAYTKFTWFHIPQFRKMIEIELDYRRKYCDFK